MLWDILQWALATIYALVLLAVAAKLIFRWD